MTDRPIEDILKEIAAGVPPEEWPRPTEESLRPAAVAWWTALAEWQAARNVKWARLSDQEWRKRNERYCATRRALTNAEQVLIAVIDALEAEHE